MTNILQKQLTAMQSGMQANDPEDQDMNVEAVEELEAEAEIKRPKGVYSLFCNVIHAGKGHSYKWPPNTPFDMEQVSSANKDYVKAILADLIERGLAEQVE